MGDRFSMPLKHPSTSLLWLALIGLLAVLSVNLTAVAFDFNYDEKEFDGLTPEEGPPQELIDQQAGVKEESVKEAEEQQSFEALKSTDIPEEQRKYMYYDFRNSLSFCLTKIEAHRQGFWPENHKQRCDQPKKKN